MANKADEFPFPVYATQGGGLVRFVGDIPIFVEAPKDFAELTIGSEMPEQWGVIPANKLALAEMNQF